MPIYEYKCEECGFQTEMLQKISDPPAITCPACGADSLKKLVSAAAFKLKGTGWYETDFKDKKPKSAEKSSSSKSSAEKKGADKAKEPAKPASNSSNSGSKSASSE